MNTRPELLVHIGTAKTGTTTVQEYLYLNRARLEEYGVLYPTSLGHKNHIRIAAYAVPEPWKVAGNFSGIDSIGKQQEFRKELERQLDNEVRSGKYRRVLISNEHLHSRLITPDQIQLLKELFARHFSRVAILVYFRRQDLMSVSRYSTALRAGLMPLSHFHGKGYLFDYLAVYNNWANAFGAENVTVRIFSRDRFLQGNFLVDFRAAAGLEERDDYLLPESRNESLSFDAERLILELNERIRAGSLSLKSRERRGLTEWIAGQYRGRVRYPGREDAVRFYRHFLASNKELLLRLSGRLDRLFDEDFSMYPEVEDKTTVEEKTVWAKSELDRILAGMHREGEKISGNC